MIQTVCRIRTRRKHIYKNVSLKQVLNLKVPVIDNMNRDDLLDLDHQTLIYMEVVHIPQFAAQEPGHS